jgi:hypothetical protein
LQLWLDASDPWSLFDATTGGSGVASGGTVKRWQDKSGNARHCTEATSAPTRQLSAVNGRDVLRFNGSQFLQGTSTPVGGNVRTFIGVFQQLNTPSDVFFQFGTNPTSGDTYGFIARAGVSGSTSFVGGDITTSNLTVNQALTFTSPFVCSMVESSNSSNRYFFNGAEKTVSGTLGSFNMNPGYFVGKARTTVDVNFFNGNACEIIAYDAALSDANRSAIEAYLMTKWGIA